jgi:hypothetical protein
MDQLLRKRQEHLWALNIKIISHKIKADDVFIQALTDIRDKLQQQELQRETTVNDFYAENQKLIAALTELKTLEANLIIESLNSVATTIAAITTAKGPDLQEKIQLIKTSSETLKKNFESSFI